MFPLTPAFVSLREYAASLYDFLKNYKELRARDGQPPEAYIPLHSSEWDSLHLPPPLPTQLQHCSGLPPHGAVPARRDGQQLTVGTAIKMLSSGMVSEEQEFVLLQRLHIALDTANDRLTPTNELPLPDTANVYWEVPLEEPGSTGRVTVDVHLEEEGATAAASAAPKGSVTFSRH